MISSEVQRTLVKSPPELWAELSDPAALARHLGELGEIRIVRTEPEKLVEWEAEGTTGTVQIKPSGWGTKVTLTVDRELPEQLGPAEEPGTPEETAAAIGGEAPQEAKQIEGGAAQEPIEADPPEAPEQLLAEPEQAIAEAEEPLADTAEALVEAEKPAADAEEPIEADDVYPSEPPFAEAEEPFEIPAESTIGLAAHWDPEEELEPRRGFLARLFGRRRRRPPEPEVDPMSPAPAVLPTAEEPLAIFETPAAPTGADAGPAQADDSEPVAEIEPQAEPAPAAAEPDAAAEDETASTPDRQEPDEAEPKDQPDLAAELRAAEEVKAVLTAVLDRLGAAHHRPFSRA